MKNIFRALILFLIPILMVSLACQSASPNRIKEVVQESTQGAVPVQPTQTEAVVQPPEATKAQVAQPTATVEPTAVPSPEVLPLDLLDNVGFVQNNTSVTAIFFISNPNESLVIENSDYQVTVYDKNGTVLSTDSGYISIVLPGETLAYATSVYLQEGQVADRVEVQTVSGDTTELEFQGPLFTITKAEFIADQYMSTITGMVKNTLNRDVTDLRVTAVAYDEAGKILGGGMTYVDFIPASGETGVEIYVDVAGNPAKVEIYPALSSLSEFEEENPNDIAVELVDFGYGIVDTQMSVVFLVKNTSADLAVADSQYQTIVYDASGKVLTTDSGYIDWIFPGETTAGYSPIFLPEGSKMDHVDVQINAGEPKVTDLMANPFTYDTPTYRFDDYNKNVYTTLHNSSDKLADDIETVVVAYNADGKIIGGGDAYANFIPASGSAPIDVSLTVSEAPDHFEVYPSIYTMSSFKNVQNQEIVSLAATGFSQGDYDTKAVFEVENADTENAYESSEYIVAAYTAEGELVATDSGYLPVLMPGTKFAYASGLYLIGAAKIERVEIQINPGNPAAVSTSGPLFTSQQANFMDDPYSPKVTGIIASSAAKDLQSVMVVAVLYDEAGAIIGGGYTYADLIPANSTAAVEMYVTVKGTVARVELFAAPSSVSDIQ